MGTRRANPRLAKIHRSYSVDEVSRLFGIHKNTVRNWLRRGLRTIDVYRPTLIKGADLRRFLIDSRAQEKQACGPGRIYCLPCHIEQAKGFKRALADQRGHRSGDPLSKATLYATLTALKRFFIWLAGQPGYKSRISYSDAEYFNLSAKEARIAKATRPARIPTLEQIRHVIQSMPATTDIERRDRTLIAFTILTGARDGAIASFKLRHIDIAEGKIDQDAREVRTKFSKSFVTTFFPVGDDIRAVVVDWVAYLRFAKLWGLDDPLFPATKVALLGDNLRFGAVGLDRKHWSNAGPIRTIFKEAFTDGQMLVQTCTNGLYCGHKYNRCVSRGTRGVIVPSFLAFV